MQTCETCQFGRILWRLGDPYKDFAIEDGFWGWKIVDKTSHRKHTSVECRRFPANYKNERPVMHADDWCGEYKPANNEPFSP